MADTLPWSRSSPHQQAPVKSTKRDRIVAELRRMIKDGELPRGARVQQDLIADTFDTSITPVREALHLLEAEGLLVSEPHRGVRVANADFEQVKTIYLRRMLLESYAMRRSVRRVSPRDLDIAQSLIDKMKTTQQAVSNHGVAQLNRQFHFLFYEKCGNDGLVTEIVSLWRQWPWDLLEVLEDRASSAPAEHQAILDAVRSGDVERAAETTEQHFSASFSALAAHITGVIPPDPFLIDND